MEVEVQTTTIALSKHTQTEVITTKGIERERERTRNASHPRPHSLTTEPHNRRRRRTALVLHHPRATLSARGFTLHRTFDSLNLDHLNSVFSSVGFPRRDPNKLRLALSHSSALVWVEYDKTERPVAFARATGDGVFNAIIWDVVVDPSYQGLGLGKAVMERLMSELLEMGVSNIALYSEPRVLGFYRPLGFVADPSGIRGMVYSRKNNRRR